MAILWRRGRSGIISATTRTRKKKRNRRAIGFGEYADIYLQRYAKVRKATWDDDRNAIKKYLLPAFGFTPINEITRVQVWELLDYIAVSYPGTANRLKSQLSRMFTIAIDWGYLPHNHVNPASRIPRYPETERDRFLSGEEHARLESAIDNEKCPYIRSYFRLLLRTALRKSELRKLCWTDVNLPAREIRLEKGKNKARRTFYLPISDSAAQILQSIPHVPGNAFVFPGFDPRTGQLLTTSRPRANVDAAWQKLRIKAGIPDVWIHDLRRTAASYMAQDGETLHLIGNVLNQSTPSTTARYARFKKGDIKEALDRLAKRLDDSMPKPNESESA